MHGQADCFALIGQCALDGLFDPPGSIGTELTALGWVETFDCFYQADVALADEIEERKAKIVVIVSDLHH